uniref:Amidophosphoribosyltransferase n=1 Tax=Calcidiscus leptoporus TaxID=127549 RepID=A0A7S0J5Z9_9EUKA|mmetsp:Transcript_41093/g.95970  ORF Transcript_41093/g.95970 Transcript_41093/m.95970 type:complete len:574 (+) Transcript_41093:114-1835(+)
MCGIAAVLCASDEQAAGILYEALLALQHRGQDAAGIITESKSGRLCLHKDNGMVRDVFLAQQLRNLRGPLGIGHVRYPTAGSSSSSEAQPFYVNSPYGITLAHNGNLVGVPRLKAELRQQYRHLNTGSDSEVLLNLLATELLKRMPHERAPSPAVADAKLSRRSSLISDDGGVHDGVFPSGPSDEQLIAAVEATIERCAGGFAVVAMISGFGLLGFRDPNGIRPLSFGQRDAAEPTFAGDSPSSPGGRPRDVPAQPHEFMICSESGALSALGFNLIGDVPPGHALLLRPGSTPQLHDCMGPTVPRPIHCPCVFEFVYFARPDSVLDGVSVYRSRLKMGEKLAKQIMETWEDHQIDVVIPVPDTARTAALECASTLKIPYREGFMKNRYVGRTFIMPAQRMRTKSVRRKLSPIASEFAERNVLLVDDSIVRGTTSREIVQMAREAGAKRVYMASAAPPVRFPNVYGIDMPTKDELVASKYVDLSEVAKVLGCDRVVYQELDDLKAAIFEAAGAQGKPLHALDCSCFDGQYVTSCVGEAFLSGLAMTRTADRGAECNESHLLYKLDACPSERPAA